MYVVKNGNRVSGLWQAQHQCRECGALLGVTESDLFLGGKGETQFECPCCKTVTEIFSYVGERQLHTRMQWRTLRKACAGVSRADSPEPMLYQKLKELADGGCPFCPVSALNINLAHEFTICRKCGCRRYLDGRVTDPIKKGVKKEEEDPPLVVKVTARVGIEDRIDELEEQMGRVLGHLVLD